MQKLACFHHVVTINLVPERLVRNILLWNVSILVFYHFHPVSRPGRVGAGSPDPLDSYDCFSCPPLLGVRKIQGNRLGPRDFIRASETYGKTGIMPDLSPTVLIEPASAPAVALAAPASCRSSCRIVRQPACATRSPRHIGGTSSCSPGCSARSDAPGPHGSASHLSRDSTRTAKSLRDRSDTRNRRCARLR